MSIENAEHAALVTDLEFCLRQLANPAMPDLAKKLFEDRVTHHEDGLGITSFVVANTAEVVPFVPVEEPALAAA